MLPLLALASGRGAVDRARCNKVPARSRRALVSFLKKVKLMEERGGLREIEGRRVILLSSALALLWA